MLKIISGGKCAVSEREISLKVQKNEIWAERTEQLTFGATVCFYGCQTSNLWQQNTSCLAPYKNMFFFVSCPCLAATDDISACRCTRIGVTIPRTLSLRLFSPPSPLVVLLCKRFCPMVFVQNSPLVQVVKFEICVLRLVRMVKSWDQQAFEFVRFILVVNEWYFIVIIWSMTCLKAYL